MTCEDCKSPTEALSEAEQARRREEILSYDFGEDVKKIVGVLDNPAVAKMEDAKVFAILDSIEAVTVLDVATYILDRLGQMPAQKLQKLVYYSQAWSLAWDDAPLFPTSIEARGSGPTSPELYEKHKGQFLVSHIEGGDPKRLVGDAKETVDKVLEFYGGQTTHWLIQLSITEDPWKSVRSRMDFDSAPVVIEHSAMSTYYKSLLAGGSDRPLHEVLGMIASIGTFWTVALGILAWLFAPSLETTPFLAIWGIGFSAFFWLWYRSRKR